MGVFKQTKAGFERVADRWQDTMAFTVTGDDNNRNAMYAVAALAGVAIAVLAGVSPPST